MQQMKGMIKVLIVMVFVCSVLYGLKWNLKTTQQSISAHAATAETIEPQHLLIPINRFAVQLK